MKQSLLALTTSAALSMCVFAADEPKKDADNTAKNERDRNNKTLTPTHFHPSQMTFSEYLFLVLSNDSHMQYE